MPAGKKVTKIGRMYFMQELPPLEQIKNNDTEGFRRKSFPDENFKLFLEENDIFGEEVHLQDSCVKLSFKNLDPDFRESLSEDNIVNNFITVNRAGLLFTQDPTSIQCALGFITEPQISGQYHSHIGEELILVIGGKLRYRDILKNNIVLEKGQLLRCRSELFHELSSATFEDAQVLVLWWGPSIRSSMLEITKKGCIDDQTIYTRSKLVPGEIRININEIDQNTYAGIGKYCNGIPQMIKHHLNTFGLVSSSLQFLIERTPRFIDELLNKLLDPSIEVLLSLAKNLKISTKSLIWRYEDKEPWVQRYKTEDFHSNNELPGSVFSVDYCVLNPEGDDREKYITNSRLSNHDTPGAGPSEKNIKAGDNIIYVLDGALLVQKLKTAEIDPSKTEASAGPDEALYLRSDENWIILPIRKEVRFLLISINEHACELEEGLKRRGKNET